MKAAVGLLALAVGCGDPTPQSDTTSTTPRVTPSPSTPSPVASPSTASPPTAPPSGPRRVVAIGDLHGDLQATREVLRMAKITDPEGHWAAGRTLIVQTGDVLDRGDEEIEIYDLLDRLAKEAKASGGAVHILNGNHELMNVAGRFLYVTPDGFRDFAGYDDGSVELTAYPKLRRGRRAAFKPGGPFAKRLADYPVVLRIDDTLFVHGGLLPKHVKFGIDTINARARSFALGEDDAFWAYLTDWDSPVNMRHYTKSPNAADCYLLDKVLKETGAKRMVMGHTPQLGGIKSYCGGKAWGIDACMSRHCGDARQALELLGDDANILQ